MNQGHDVIIPGPEFYERDDVVSIARELVGKVLCTDIDGAVCKGIIVETEAYHGRMDRACHAFNKRTARTEVMYGPGGTAYVYLCYGIHNLFNIVTNSKGVADAVLVRALEPLEGLAHMLKRRKMEKAVPALTAGPGSLSKAMGIDRGHYGSDLFGPPVWIEDHGIRYASSEIVAGPRIGVDYAGDDALLPWRFWVKGNKWVSRHK